jgi:tetratricopeptide (TPR) repeat protein
MSSGVTVTSPSVETRQHLDRAYDLLDRGDYEAALAECQSAAEETPDCAELHNLRGLVLDDAGRLEGAVAAYRLAVRWDPTFGEAWENLSEAESALEKSLYRGVSREADSAERAQVHLDQASALLQREEYGSVLHECDSALRLLPGCGRAYSLCGDVLLQLGRLEQAVAAYSMAVRSDRTLVEAWEGLLKAEAALEAGLGAQVDPDREGGPDQIQAHLERAYDCLEGADYQGVLRACRAALSLAPECAEAHNLRGVALDDLGHPREAVGAYRLALHYSPGLEDALENLVEVEREIVPVAPVALPAPTLGKAFGIRAAAYLIDGVLFYISNLVAAFLAGVAVGMLVFWLDQPSASAYLWSGGIPDWAYNVAGIVVFLLYFGLFEWLYGATPGKLALGMRVVAQDGGRCSAKAALLRGLLRYWDAFFFCVPALVSMEAPLHQRVGDKAARTMVVGAKDPAIRERREWGWFIVAAWSFLALHPTAYILLTLGVLSAIGRL